MCIRDRIWAAAPLAFSQGVPDEYDGDRTAARIVAWAQRKLNPELPTFTSEAALQGWLDGKTVSAVLFVSSLESEVEAVEAMRGVAGARAPTRTCSHARARARTYARTHARTYKHT
eukprot:207536-Pleurochrysis_carterae.AAC.1